MGFEIVLESEKGEAILSLEDPTNVLHRILPSPEDVSFHCINRIDWYGDTTFNGMQAVDFQREFARVADAAKGSGEIEFVSRLQEMAVRCQKEPHLYLKFYGD